MIDKKDVIERAWKNFLYYLKEEIKIAEKVDAMHHDMWVTDIKEKEIKEEECIRYIDSILCKLHYNMRYFVKSKWFAQEFRRVYSGVLRREERR